MKPAPAPVIVVSHASALRGIRSARRRYGRLPWRALNTEEQARVLNSRTAHGNGLDRSLLFREGFTDGDDAIDALVGGDNLRPHTEELSLHVISTGLPQGSIIEVAPGVYSVCPALAVIQYAQSHDLHQTIALLMELRGSFSLPENHTLLADNATPICAGEDDPSLSYYEGDPVLTGYEMEAMLKNVRGINGMGIAARANAIALDGARSPMEAIMAALFHAPRSAGGFGLSKMLLNHTIEFNEEATKVSGMRKAICDAYVFPALSTLEYNGSYHDATVRRQHDEKRDMGLSAMGIKTFPLNDQQLRNIEAMEVIAKMVHRRAGKRYDNRTKGYRVKQIALLNGLRCAFGLRPC